MTSIQDIKNRVDSLRRELEDLEYTILDSIRDVTYEIDHLEDEVDELEQEEENENRT